jgi:hypothetical protein
MALPRFVLVVDHRRGRQTTGGLAVLAQGPFPGYQRPEALPSGRLVGRVFGPPAHPVVQGVGRLPARGWQLALVGPHGRGHDVPCLSPLGGPDHRKDSGPDRFGQSVPRLDYKGQIRVGPIAVGGQMVGKGIGRLTQIIYLIGFT